MSGRQILRGIFHVGCLLWSLAFAVAGFIALAGAVTLGLVLLGTPA